MSTDKMPDVVEIATTTTQRATPKAAAAVKKVAEGIASQPSSGKSDEVIEIVTEKVMTITDRTPKTKKFLMCVGAATIGVGLVLMFERVRQNPQAVKDAVNNAVDTVVS